MSATLPELLDAKKLQAELEVTRAPRKRSCGTCLSCRLRGSGRCTSGGPDVARSLDARTFSNREVPS